MPFITTQTNNQKEKRHSEKEYHLFCNSELILSKVITKTSSKDVIEDTNQWGQEYYEVDSLNKPVVLRFLIRMIHYYPSFDYYVDDKDMNE